MMTGSAPPGAPDDEAFTGSTAGATAGGSQSPSMDFLRAVAQAPDAAPNAFELQLAALGALAEDRGARFLARRRLGSGGFGVVYEALDRERGATVALKVLRRRDGLSIQRFKHEFRALADLTHDNLVQLYELHASDETWFFTMELVPGTHALEHVRGADGRCDEARLRAVFLQLATGLSSLHRAGWLHRDVKPSNVMVTPEGRVVLVDFGLVSDLADARSAQAIQGTPAYMAPEQAAGQPVDEAADWYAVGVMLYQALTSQLPALNSGETSSLRAARTSRERAWIPPSALVADVPADLEDLCLDLLERAPERRPSGAEVLRRLGAPAQGLAPGRSLGGEVPFVGRVAELGALRAALRAADGGATTAALVLGRSGIGKSALLQRFLDELRAGDPERVVLQGRCHEQESVPYKGVDGLLEDLCARIERRQGAGDRLAPPTGLSALARVFPQIGALFDSGAALRGADEGPGLRARAFAALGELLGRLSPRAPVLVVDDLQWGDLDGVALLAAIVAGRAPLLLIASFRAEEAESNEVLQALFAALDAQGEALDLRRVEVGALADREAGALTRALLLADGAGGPIDDEAVAALVTEGQGDPFLLSELTRLGAAARPREPHLAALLSERIGRLPAAARRFLEVVALEGQPLARTIAAEGARGAAGVSEALGAVGVLRAARLIRSRRTERAEEVLPYHDRVREVVVRGLGPGAARAHHERMAGVYGALPAPDPERLHYHYRGAGRLGDAARWAEVAAGRAREALAFDGAARLYREVLALREAAAGEAPLEQEEERRVRVALAEALAGAGRPREAALAWLEAADGAAIAEAQPRRRRAAELLLNAGYMDEGFAVLRGVLHEVGLGFSTALPRALLGVAWGRLRVGLRGLGFRERSEAAVGARELQRIDACHAATVGLFLVNPILAAASQARHLILALEAGEPLRVARALGLEALVSSVRRGPGEAGGQALKTALALGRRLDQPRLTGLLRLCEANVAYTAGRWRRGYELLVQSQSVLREHGADTEAVIDLAGVQRANFLWMLGEIDGLRRLVPTLVEEARDRGNRLLEMMLRLANEPTLALFDGRPDRGREAIAAALDRWPRAAGSVLHVREVSSRARLALYEGRPDLAITAIQEALSAMRPTGLILVPSQTAELRVWRAMAALSLGDDRLAARDARALARLPFPWARGAALLVRAGLARRAGRLAAALALLDETRERSRLDGTALFGAAMARRQGAWRGGAEGGAQVADADAWMTARGVADPERMTATLLGWVP